MHRMHMMSAWPHNALHHTMSSMQACICSDCQAVSLLDGQRQHKDVSVPCSGISLCKLPAPDLAHVQMA